MPPLQNGFLFGTVFTLSSLQAILPFFIVHDLNMHQSAKAVVRLWLTHTFPFPRTTSVPLPRLSSEGRGLDVCTVGDNKWLLGTCYMEACHLHACIQLFLQQDHLHSQGRQQPLSPLLGPTPSGCATAHSSPGCPSSPGSPHFLWPWDFAGAGHGVRLQLPRLDHSPGTLHFHSYIRSSSSYAKGCSIRSCMTVGCST